MKMSVIAESIPI